jgi:hypothetical protein
MSRKPGIKWQIVKALQDYPDGLTINQIRELLGLTSEQQEMGRRMRELVSKGDLARVTRSGATVYVARVDEYKPVPKDTLQRVSNRQRAEIIWNAHQRCQMCGRSLDETGELHVDHKIPQSWGGSSDDENLWAICSQCNEGKRDFFATVNDPRVQQAMLGGDIHVRLGELLKAFGGQPVPSKYLELVAYTHDDWQKRLRELRELGWQYHFVKKRDETGRVRTHFVLDHWEPWPTDPAGAIREAERKRNNRR